MADSWNTIGSWITANPATKGLAVLVALTAWLFVQQDVERQTAVTARVRWVWPQGLVPTEPLRSQVQVVVEGPRAATNRVRRVPIDQRIVLSGLPAGGHTIELAALDWPGVPPSVRIVGFDPPSIPLVLDEVAQQPVRLIPKLIGDPPAGHAVATTTLEPSVIEVSGPRSVVSELVEVPTKPLDVSSMTAPATLDAPLELPRGVSITGPRPKATIEVVVVADRLEGLVVPVHVFGHPGWVTEPATVRLDLRGPATALREIEARLADEGTPLVAFVRSQDGTPPRGEARYLADRGARLEVWPLGCPDVEVEGIRPDRVRVEAR